MKSEQLNHVILFVSVIVFVLQSVGYFAPGWFIKEIVVKSSKDGMVADGRMFKLPYWDELSEDDEEDTDQTNEHEQQFPSKPHMSSPHSNGGPPGDALHNLRRRSIPHPIDPKKHNTSTFSGSKLHKVFDEDKTQERITKIPVPIQIAVKHVQTTVGLIQGPLDTSSDKKRLSRTDKPTGLVVAVNKKFETITRKGMNKRRYILSLSTGLWYSRACVYLSPNGSDIYTAEDKMEWCAMYVRMDDRTLEMKTNMFEFRVETTIALAASALSLVLASTGCCSHRRHGTRAILSLSTMFLSGALMSVPVVHMIIAHVEIHGHLMSRRKMNLPGHHLFDHYSVMICAVASFLSILSTIVIVIIKCRSNSIPTNRYDVTHDDTKKNEFCHELPISWVHSPMSTVSVATMVKDDGRDETESGYSELKEDDLPSSSIEAASVEGEGDANEYGQLELVPSELKTFEM